MKLVCRIRQRDGAVVLEHPTNADRRVNPKRNSLIKNGKRDMLRAGPELQLPEWDRFRGNGCSPVFLVSSEIIPGKAILAFYITRYYVELHPLSGNHIDIYVRC
jgi:hypothetical protein